MFAQNGVAKQNDTEVASNSTWFTGKADLPARPGRLSCRMIQTKKDRPTTTYGMKINCNFTVYFSDHGAKKFMISPFTLWPECISRCDTSKIYVYLRYVLTLA